MTGSRLLVPFLLAACAPPASVTAPTVPAPLAIEYAMAIDTCPTRKPPFAEVSIPMDAVASLACDRLAYMSCAYWFNHEDCVKKYIGFGVDISLCVANAYMPWDVLACGQEDCQP